MLRAILPIAAGSLLLLAGCHTQPVAPPPRPMPPDLPTVGRGKIEPDVSAVSTEPPANPPSLPKQYALLTARECIALAFENAPFADDLVAHPGDTAACKRDSDEAKLSHTVRCYAADDIRNRTTSEALEMYYKLAAAEGQFDLAAAGDKVLRTQLAAAIRAERQGLREADIHAIQRQLLGIESQVAKLRATITVLNAGLRDKLGMDPAAGLPIWPADPLRPSAEDMPVEQALTTGFYFRPDLNLLRVMAKDEKGGKLANDLLKSVNPLLGNADPSIPFVAFMKMVKRKPTRAAAITQQEIKDLLVTREREADGEIRAAVAVQNGARAAVAAKAAEVRHQSNRVADLEKKVAAGIAGANSDLVTARLDLLKLRGELLAAVADWFIAEVKLRQSMGLLIRDSGASGGDGASGE